MYRRLRFLINRILSGLKNYLGRFRSYIKVTEASDIARRYFVMNAFDGALTILGVIVGAFMIREVNPRVIIGAGVGASLAMGISGAWGAYMAERAERRRSLKELENHMFRNLEGSILDKASKAAALWIALVDGLSPALAAAIPLMPFAMVLAHIIPVETGLVASLTLNLFILFTLGVFLGKVSHENIWIHGLLMVGAGILTALLLLVFLGR